jgi:hypothetical protein
MEVLTDKLKYETNNINKVIPIPMKYSTLIGCFLTYIFLI